MRSRLSSTVAQVAVLAVSALASASLLLAHPALQDRPAQPVVIEFYGAAEQVRADSIVVNGKVVDTTSAIFPSPLTPGSYAHVSGVIDPDGGIHASSVEVLGSGILPGLVQFSGLVAEKTDDRLLMDGLTFALTGALVSPDVQVGSLVMISAISVTDTVWIARQVSAYPSDARRPVATEEVRLSPATPAAPVITLEVRAPVAAPAATAEVFDDHGGHGSDDSGGGHSGSGGGDD